MPISQAKLDHALTVLHQLVNTVTADWMIIGTGSLYLLGYAVIPHDIDILTTAANAGDITKALAEYEIAHTTIADNKFRSAFSKYLIDDVAVELMGDLEVSTPNGWVLLQDQIKEPKIIVFNALEFTVPGITDQTNIYKLFNREKDSNILEMLARK